MNPIFFHIGSRPIYWYGVMVAAGFLIAIVHWSILARREGYPRGFGSDLGFWMMISGIFGARFAYILANLPYYLEQPIEVLRIDRGGLVFYGGLGGAILGVILLARVKKISKWAVGDLAVSALPLGHALGRIGCLLNGCCFGKATGLPWAIHLNKIMVHPTQVYEALFNLGLYGMLLWFYSRRKRDGEVFALYLLVYPIGRFLVEFLRGDERLTFLGMNVAQELSIVLFIAGCILWKFLPREKRELEA